MKYVFLVLMSLISIEIFAQCKSGNCESGKGVFDFGWCVYSGEFKNGKPDGTGCMKYSDYTYDGQFKNGIEDGRGIITYKNNTREKVVYVQGRKVEYVAEKDKISEKEYDRLTEQKTGCISGDCSTGFGTVAFTDGAKYVGNFVNKKRQGEGSFYFASGDVFQGRFDNDKITKGTYNFSNGYSFTGVWDAAGNMTTGTYTAPAGNTVDVVNGKVIMPKVSDIASTTSKDPCAEKISCPVCKGKPYKIYRNTQTSSTIIGGISSIDRYGNKKTEYGSQTINTTTSIPSVLTCAHCQGKGKVCKKENVKTTNSLSTSSFAN